MALHVPLAAVVGSRHSSALLRMAGLHLSRSLGAAASGDAARACRNRPTQVLKIDQQALDWLIHDDVDALCLLVEHRRSSKLFTGRGV